MVRHPVILPELGADDEIRLSGWLVENSESVEEGDRLAEVLIGGIIFSLDAPAAGRLVQRHRRVNAVLRTGDTLGWIEDAEGREMSADDYTPDISDEERS